MHKDIMTALVEEDANLAKTIMERDDEVDRLYFLLVRLLRTAILNPHLSEKMKLSLIDCLDYRLVASFIESIADYACEIARNILEFSGTPIPGRVLETIQSLGNLSYNMQEEAMRAIFSMDLKLADSVQKKQVTVKELVRGIDGLLAGQKPDVISYASSVVSSTERISNYNIDISDLVTPR